VRTANFSGICREVCGTSFAPSAPAEGYGGRPAEAQSAEAGALTSFNRREV